MRLRSILPLLKKHPRLVAGGVVASVGVLALLARSRVITVPTFYFQGDPEWAELHVGFSTETMEDVGCLVASLAHASNAQARTLFSPADVNELAKDAGAFSGPNLVLVDAADVVGIRAPEEERIRAGRGAGPDELRARIDQALAAGGGAIVNVDAHSPTGDGTHFVYVHGKRGSQYLAVDPAGDGVANPHEITIDASTMRASSTWNRNPFVVGVAPVYAA